MSEPTTEELISQTEFAVDQRGLHGLCTPLHVIQLLSDRLRSQQSRIEELEAENEQLRRSNKVHEERFHRRDWK